MDDFTHFDCLKSFVDKNTKIYEEQGIFTHEQENEFTKFKQIETPQL